MSNKGARVIPLKKNASVLIPASEFDTLDQHSEDGLLLQSISKNINEAIYRSVRGKGLVYINDAFVKMFGYTNEFEILNQNELNLYSNPRDQEWLAKEIIKYGSVADIEIEYKRKDGSVFNGSFSSTMVIGNDGITYFDGAIRDITNRKAAEEQLNYQSEMQRALISISTQYLNQPLDSIDKAIINSLEELGSFLEVDRLQIHKYDFVKNECSTTYEWRAKGIKSTKNGSQRVPLDAIMDMVACHFDGKNLFIEDVNQLESGFVKDVLMSKKIKSVLTVPLMLENNCVGFISLDTVRKIRNYTDSEITMIQLFANMSVNIISRANNQKKLHSLLETTTIQKKRLKDFSQITSHNIRASVANLVAINNLFQDGAENVKYLEYLDITIDKLNKSINNINSLLNFDNKNEVMDKKQCNIGSSIKRVLKVNKESIFDKNLIIVNRLPEKLYVNSFPAYLDEIFHNLISNAIKYGTDSKSKKIHLDACVDGQFITINVKDFGQGIDLTRHGKKLFKAGVQLHDENCESQGMGLFISNYMIEAIGGSIEVESELNKGATFKAIFRNE